MRKVTLFTTVKQLVVVHGGVIQYYVQKPIMIYGSEPSEFLDGTAVRDIQNLPVERWVFDGKEFLIALDPELREIVDCMINSSTATVRREMQERINERNSRIINLQSRTIWDMILSLFKRKSKNV